MPANFGGTRGGGGPALFAYCLDIFLYGILTVQTYLYYLAFPNDKRITKAIVYFVYVVGTMQTGFALHDFYSLFCTPKGKNVFSKGSGNGPSVGGDTHVFGFMLVTIPICSAAVAIAVQFLYAYRIYTISGRKVITVVVFLLSILQLVLGIYSAATVYTPGALSLDSPVQVFANGLAWGLSGALCDTLIALYMFYFVCDFVYPPARNILKLFFQLSVAMKGASRFTQTPLTRIKRLVLETGLLTAAVAVTFTITSTLLPSDDWYMIPGLSLSKVYANSMLVLFNNRFTITEGRNDAQTSYRHPATSSGLVSTYSCPESTYISGDSRTVRGTSQLNSGEEKTIQEA